MKTLILVVFIIISLGLNAQQNQNFNRQFILANKEEMTVPSDKYWIVIRTGFLCSTDSVYFQSDLFTTEGEHRVRLWKMMEEGSLENIPSTAMIIIENKVCRYNYTAIQRKGNNYVTYFLQGENEGDRNVALGNPYKLMPGTIVKIAYPRWYVLIYEYNLNKIQK
jgi:hypothetical protein